jgi:hypothetical protein
VAVRQGRQARSLSDTSDDDFMPETEQQQKHIQQLGTAVSSATQPAEAAGGDMEAQHDGASATTRIVYKVTPC